MRERINTLLTRNGLAYELGEDGAVTHIAAPVARELIRHALPATGAVLGVEHDLRFVAGAADVVTVLDEGAVIARGTPDEVIADAGMRKAYLG